MQNVHLLQNLSIILVKTKTPGNIGSIARCMLNMGLSKLLLVRPTEYKNSEALRLAAGAHQILESAEVFPSLQEAIDGHHLVFGTSRQISGRYRKNFHTARKAAEMILPLLQNNRVAVVFGREVNGLDNSELALCHEVISIPSSEVFPSINLSHALMIVAYELYIASGAILPKSRNPLADASHLEDFYQHLERAMHKIGLLEKNNPGQILASFRQMFGRARLEDRDVRILRGMLSQIEDASGYKDDS